MLYWVKLGSLLYEKKPTENGHSSSFPNIIWNSDHKIYVYLHDD